MKKTTMRGMSILMVLLALVLVASGVQAQATDNADTITAYAKLGAGIALAGCGMGTGLAQGPIGAAAVGMIAEDGSKFGVGLLFTELPETIVLFGFLSIYLL